MAEKLIELKNISKQFPGVLANSNVNLTINKGEIHAIIGENGAGKTTLMNILYGLYEPTKGEIFIDGKKAMIKSPLDAIKQGIGMVHQHFMLLPSLSVAENVVLGSEPKKKKFFMDYDKAIEITKNLAQKYGFKVDPHEKIEALSVGVQQRVEILKVLYRGADILILDEPTAVLTPQETDELFNVIRKLVSDMNKTVIIITHKLQEVLAISDRVSVMRQGKLIGTLPTQQADAKILTEMMVGKEVLFHDLHREKVSGEKVLEVKDIKAKDNRGLTVLNGVSFSLRAGEILGVAGVEGNGQSELVEVLTGLRNLEDGDYFINGKKITEVNPSNMRNLGISHVPEDRLTMGLSKEASLWENLLMGLQHKKPFVVKKIHLNKKKIFERTDNLIKEYDIRAIDRYMKVKKLSGGNMQKVVIAREFSFDSPILIIAQPTRGVDVGATEFIHNQIMRKRNEGAAILLVSAELDEIMRLSDRIITIYEGSITGEFKNKEVTKQTLGLYMTGKQNKLKGSEDN